MRYSKRPGNLGNVGYWFGNTDQSMVQQKLKEIELANKQNHTPLSAAQRTARIKQHLANPRRMMQGR